MKNYLGILGVIALFVQPVVVESIVVDGSTTVGPIAKAFAEYFMQLIQILM